MLTRVVRVLSWNVAGRVKAVAKQAAAVVAQGPDVVALQEVRQSALAAWRAELAAAGYRHQRSSLEEVDLPEPPPPLRRLGVMVASRMPVVPAGRPELPWPERYLAVGVGGFTLHVLHAPISQKAGEVKIRTLESVFAHLTTGRVVTDRDGAAPQMLVGDLNTPRYESREGEIVTFARTSSGRLRADRGTRHDAAELALIATLPDEHGWADAFRSLHGYGRRDRSWTYPHGRFGYRLDHVMVRDLHVTACEYVHAVREHGLSDHSAVWADVETAAGR